MKMRSIRSISILLAGAAMLSFAGCSKEPGDVSGRSGDPQTPGSRQDALTSFGFDRRDEFVVQFKSMHTEFAAQLREYQAANSDAGTGDNSAMSEVLSAEADFKNKLDAASTADAGSWNTARDNVTAAWERLQAAFGRLHVTRALPSQGL